MDLLDAINQRWSCRAFLDKPVERETLEKLLQAASRAPSGVNHQPWHVAVLTGDTKKNLSQAIVDARQNGQKQHPDYAYYSSEIKEPYLTRRKECGIALYKAQGIARDDYERREKVWEDNYRFFDAPVGLIIYLEGYLEKGSWLDLGMFIENILLGALSFGLGACPQAALSEYPDIVRGHLNIDKKFHIACGISLGYPDHDAPVNQYRLDRVGLEDFVTFYE